MRLSPHYYDNNDVGDYYSCAEIEHMTSDCGVVRNRCL